MIKLTKTIHRNYTPSRPWIYKAVETRIDNKIIIYYQLLDNGEYSEGLETYSGPNYDITVKRCKSYSRHYPIDQIPTKYKDTVEQLKMIHERLDWNLIKVNEA